MGLDVGDKVILSVSDRWSPGLPVMKRGTVQKINTSSTYILIDDGDHKVRFLNQKKKRMTANDLLNRYEVMESVEEFNQKVSDIVEKSNLSIRVCSNIMSVSLDGLRKINNILESEGVL